MKVLLAVGLGGFIGAIARYAIHQWFQTTVQSKFPWGILIANVLGCLLVGVITGIAARSDSFPEPGKLFLVTGVLGALTTFSTFGLDSIQLLKNGIPLLALSNVAANVILGLGAVALGLYLTSQS